MIKLGTDTDSPSLMSDNDVDDDEDDNNVTL